MRLASIRIDSHPSASLSRYIYSYFSSHQPAYKLVETGMVFAKAKRMFKSLCKSCGNVENRRQDSTFEPFFDGLGQRFYRSITVRPRVRYRSGPLRRVLSPSL